MPRGQTRLETRMPDKMPAYHKIHSIWKRDQRGKFIQGDWARPELGYLADNEWEWTEKVDGTNIRIWCSPEVDDIIIGGRTDRAQIPATLLSAINGLDIAKRAEGLRGEVVLYGEGYGAKIQKGGGNYRSDQGFVLFDVWAGGFWLRRSDVEAVASTLGLDVVPVVGRGTLYEAISLVGAPHGVTSRWGDFRSEGVVARPSCDLFNRMGERIICKVKSRDFDRLRRS